MQQSEHGRSCPPCPLYVDFNGEPVVIVGAGDVALRKARAMLAYGACVRVVAPDPVDGIRALADSGDLELVERPFREGDTRGARYVICATDDAHVNRTAHDEADAAGLLVNVVDQPELCNVIVPAVVRRGKLQIAVSTSGAAPSAARRMRKELEERYPQFWEDYLDVLGEVRALVKERVEGPASARIALYEALTDGALEAEFACGQRPSAADVYVRYVQPLLEGSAA